MLGRSNHTVDRANLGHLAPHDLRRTAAGILHRSTSNDGAHHFDLLDIQKVLDHSDPATTMRSYLDPYSFLVVSIAGWMDQHQQHAAQPKDLAGPHAGQYREFNDQSLSQFT